MEGALVAGCGCGSVAKVYCGANPSLVLQGLLGPEIVGHEVAITDSSIHAF